MRSGWVVAGTQSGVGKTSVALGLARLLCRRGVCVQTCKAGPDYLDPTWLARASGRVCYNLDTWMCGAGYVRARVAACGAEVVLVEGAMGLFDGVEPGEVAGSTAEVAAVLGLPVVLVVDASGMAGSVAALVHGFATFSPRVRVMGVIANRIGSERHADILREALAAAGLPPLLGAIRKGAFPVLASRHLGLLPADLTQGADAVLDAMADVCETSVDVEHLLRVSACPDASAISPAPARDPSPMESADASALHVAMPRRLRIGLARDEAFCFHYPDTLAVLEGMGVTWVAFSPLQDTTLPAGLDALYLAGGYPEAHLRTLAENEPMRRAVAGFCAGGGAVYAECGGLLYLCRRLRDRDGADYPMVGVVPATGTMQTRRTRLGMVEVETRTETFFGTTGTRLRGHEYHYSSLELDADARVDADPDPCAGADRWMSAYTVRYRDGTAAPEGFWRGRILASYVHLHLASNPDAARAFLRAVAVVPKDA